MPRWKRLIIGDAFEPASRKVNFYRDLALLWPFMLFSLMAVSEVFHPTASRHYWIFLAAVAVFLLALAKEKVLLLLAVLALVAVRCVWVSIAIRRDVWVIVTGVVCGLIILLATLVGRGYRPSYDWPENTGILELLVGVGSLTATIMLKIWLDSRFG